MAVDRQNGRSGVRRPHAPYPAPDRSLTAHGAGRHEHPGAGTVHAGEPSPTAGARRRPPSPCSPAFGVDPYRSGSCCCARCSTTAATAFPATGRRASTPGIGRPTPPRGEHCWATGDLQGRGRPLHRRDLTGRLRGRTARVARSLQRLRHLRPASGPESGRPRRPYAPAPSHRQPAGTGQRFYLLRPLRPIWPSLRATPAGPAAAGGYRWIAAHGPHVLRSRGLHGSRGGRWPR